ncbi:MAG: hypothetical protein M1406_03330 [Nitrospirae bacterium]|nr:hypothetical protein [Nitrospirota bacterium]
MKKTAKIGLLAVLMVFALAAYAAAGEINIKDIKTPVPEEGIKIIPPDSSIPSDIANYSGVWEGTYDNGRDVTLIIEKIELPPGKVLAIYSWGNLGRSFGNYYKVEGAVEKDSIVFERNIDKITITISPGKTKDTANLDWERYDAMRGRRTVYTTLKKKGQ